MNRSWGYGTDQRLRSENQDTHGVFEFPEFTLGIVCDGMGGHAGGAQASSLAVRTVHDALAAGPREDMADALRLAIEEANRAIFDTARKNHRLTGMGTTVVAVAINEHGEAIAAHVGDSRAYLIQHGEIRQLTRDHTMVNLFVDAELLSPEDAATHPEAHVLSRSLGVERQVDVEVSEPFPLELDDTIVLCSDGVHGVLTDWEIAGEDWRLPHAGVDRLLEMVTDRDGDDNATAVAIALLHSGENVDPTPVPQPRDGSEPEDVPSPQGYDGPPSLDISPPSTAPPSDAPESPERGFDHLYVDPPAPTPQPVPFQKTRTASPAEERPPPQVTPAPNRRRLVVLGATATGLAIALVVVAIMAARRTDTNTEVLPKPTDDDKGVAQLTVVGPDGEPIGAAEPASGVLTIEADVPEEQESWFFSADLAPAPRRLPHRPREFTQPPPGGALQYEAVQAARSHNCAASLDAVIQGMAASEDHATLYSQAWYCFNETHQRPLSTLKLKTADEFELARIHLEGPPNEAREADTKPEGLTPTEDNVIELPDWYRPATDGIEYRLFAWTHANDIDRMHQVMEDLEGLPKVADHLGADLMLEAQFAVQLARLPANERTPELEMAWARRVFVIMSAMNGGVATLLQTHRPDLLPQIRASIIEATGQQEDSEIEVPEVVLTAYKTANGEIDPPTAQHTPITPRRKTKLKVKKEDLGPVKTEIHQPISDPLSHGRGAPWMEQGG